MNKKLLIGALGLLSVGLSFKAQAALTTPVTPWPTVGSQSAPLNAAPAAAVPTAPQQPVQLPVQQQQSPQGQSSNSPGGAALQAIQGMMGKSEFATGGDGGYNTERGTGSSLEIGGSGGVGPAGVSLLNVKACSNQTGKFQFKYGHGGEAGCDGEVKMHEDLASFINTQMGKCVNQAAGINQMTTGKIYHAGTMGDEAHQRTASLHNYGLAIDVNQIVVDGVKYTYKEKDSKTQAFFTKLRQCWSEAANRERAGCLPQRSGGKPHGSIGDEDHRHHNHLHLSLPMCRNVAGNAFMAWYVSLFIDLAHAEDPINEKEYMPPPSKFTNHKLKFAGGEGVVTVENTGGEPIGADHLISISIKCANGKTPKGEFAKIEACAFLEARYNKKARAIEAVYKTSRMKNGKVACDKSNISQAPARCD